MEYNIKPKITVYNGRVFRSRLEAKWKCMFDKLSWVSEYEPSQINGYNPDFIIKCNSPYYNCKNILVEVKPSVFINEDYFKSVYKKYSNIDAHILILDDSPFNESKESDGMLFFGFGYQFIDGRHIELSEFQMKSKNDFSSKMMLWEGMITGKDSSKQFLDINNDMNECIDIVSKWIECGNEIMFNY